MTCGFKTYGRAVSPLFISDDIRASPLRFRSVQNRRIRVSQNADQPTRIAGVHLTSREYYVLFHVRFMRPLLC